jgi:hypothetical protein
VDERDSVTPPRSEKEVRTSLGCGSLLLDSDETGHAAMMHTVWWVVVNEDEHEDDGVEEEEDDRVEEEDG